jgi:Leucine-rich repeat (LRR) protein
MSKLTTLGVLRLNTNQLSEIPPVVLQGYTNLQLLDLSRNTFVEIPNGTLCLGT